MYGEISDMENIDEVSVHIIIWLHTQFGKNLSCKTQYRSASMTPRRKA
jgi:hypothetical protein